MASPAEITRVRTLIGDPAGAGEVFSDAEIGTELDAYPSSQAEYRVMKAAASLACARGAALLTDAATAGSISGGGGAELTVGAVTYKGGQGSGSSVSAAAKAWMDLGNKLNERADQLTEFVVVEPVNSEAQAHEVLGKDFLRDLG